MVTSESAWTRGYTSGLLTPGSFPTAPAALLRVELTAGSRDVRDDQGNLSEHRPHLLVLHERRGTSPEIFLALQLLLLTTEAGVGRGLFGPPRPGPRHGAAGPPRYTDWGQLPPKTGTILGSWR